jgi:hypothetical protein
MEIAIEILQQITNTGSRVLIIVGIVGFFIGFRWYKAQKKLMDGLENLKEMQISLEIKKLLLEIELIELVLKYHSSETVKFPRIRLQKEEKDEKILPLANTPLLLWPDKMIYGLMGGLFFLTVVILVNMIVIMNVQAHDQMLYATFSKDLILSILCGIGVVLIPGNQRLDYFFYGFGLPLLLVFLMVEFKT